MKRLLLTLATVSMAAVPLNVLASNTLPTPTPATTSVPSAQQPAHLDRLKTRGGAEIDRRLGSLNVALDKIQASSKLSTNNQKTLVGQLENEISGLGTLKSKLAAETDLAAARVDVQSIIQDYRVYALMLPKARLVAAADRLAVAGGKLQVLSGHLGTKISAAKAQGKDVTVATALWNDLNAKLADAKPRYTDVADKIISLQPADYNANHAILVGDRDSLVVARTDFQTALDDSRKIITQLQNLKAATPTPSPSVSASVSPSASPTAH